MSKVEHVDEKVNPSFVLSVSAIGGAAAGYGLEWTIDGLHKIHQSNMNHISTSIGYQNDPLYKQGVQEFKSGVASGVIGLALLLGIARYITKYQKKDDNKPIQSQAQQTSNLKYEHYINS